jgi:two-component system OmpR family sensor kinase
VPPPTTLGRGLRRSYAVATLVGMLVFGIVVAIVINVHEYYDTTPEDPPIEIIQECAVAFLIAAPIGLALSVLLGRRWTSPTTHRLDEMIDAASSMTGERLDQRLDVTPNRDPLDRLAVAINGVLDRIETGVSAQRQFAADASHELRTPLAVISTNLEVARRKPREAAHWEHVADDALEQVQRMNGLVDKLLVLARAGASGLKHERADLRALAAAAVDRARIAAGAGGVELELAPGDASELDVDPDAIAIVLDNLLRNAIAHSPRGERVVISVSPDARIVVEDRGPGVPAEQRVRIFEPFARGMHRDADRTRTGGFGLGLAICRRIVDGHHGTIAVDDRPGGGARFVVALPAG